MDWFDDLDDFENDDDFESECEQDPENENQFVDDAETNHAESQDDNEFTARDAFFLGSAIGFGYEEGLRSRKRKKRNRFVDDDSD